MSKVKILSTSDISGNFANLIQIMKMANAFSEIGSEAEVYLPGKKKRVSSLVWQLRFGIKNDFPIYLIPNLKVMNKFGIISFALSSALRSRKWDRNDIIITRNERIASSLLRMRKKIVYESHTFYYPTESISQKYRQRVKSLMKKDGVCMVTISHRLKNLWRDYGIDEAKIFVAHDGVDLQEFQRLLKMDKAELKKQLGLPSEKKIICYAGSLTQDRGIEFILDAANHYKDKDYFFVVIGGKASETNHYMERSQNGNIAFIGYIMNSRIPFFLCCADLLVMPYQSSVVTIDGCSPMKIFEYLASGSYILTPKFPSFHEIMEKFEGITYYEPGDGKKFMTEIQNILDNPETARTFNRAEKLIPYSWQNRAKKILEYYTGFFTPKTSS